MNRYKYLRLARTREMTEMELNETGANGWSLVSVFPNRDKFVYLFQKQCEEDELSLCELGMEYNGEVLTKISDFTNRGLLSRRCKNALERNNVYTISELLSCNKELLNEMNKTRNFGKHSKDELSEFIRKNNFIQVDTQSL